MEPTSTAELFKVKDGMKAVDVLLVVQVVREPINIFSSNTGKSYRLLDIHASSSRGDIVKVSLWGDDIDRLSPQVHQGALLHFKMFKAQKVTSPKFHVGTFDFTLAAQRDSSISVVTEKFKLKQLPLSSLRDIDMTVTCRHRLCFEITQKFVSHDNDKGLIGYGTLYDANWTATKVTAQIVLRQNAPLLRYVLAVKNRVMVTGTVGRSGSLVEITAESLKDVELAKSTEMIKPGMLLPSSSQSLTSTSSSSRTSTGDRIFAKDINEFDGGHRSGYVLGVVLDPFEFEGESFKGELLIEDEEAATLPVTLSQVATTEGQSFVTDARVQIRGLLQFGPEHEVEFTASADDVRFVDNEATEKATSEEELPVLSASDLIGLKASSVLGIVDGVLVKQFSVVDDVAVGLLRVKGSVRSLLLRVSLQFESGGKLSSAIERGSQLRLSGVVSREKESSSLLEMDVMTAEGVILKDSDNLPPSTPSSTPKGSVSFTQNESASSTPKGRTPSKLKRLVSLTPKGPASALRSRSKVFSESASLTVDDSAATASSSKAHTGNSPVKREAGSPTLGGLVNELFEDGELSVKRRRTVLRELYNDQGKKVQAYQLESDSDSD